MNQNDWFGDAIEWPDHDEHIGIERLLAGHSNGEKITLLERLVRDMRQTRPRPS